MIYVIHLIVDEHSIMETFIFHVAPVVVVAIVNVKVDAVTDRACSRYTIKEIQMPYYKFMHSKTVRNFGCARFTLYKT